MKIALGCSSINGDFTILDAEYYRGAVVRFAARFTQHCDGLTYARSGTVYFNSMGAVQPLSIKTLSLPDAATGIDYSQSLVAEGGTQPYTWKLASGQAPPGLTLSTSGLLSGTPVSMGEFSFAAHVTDSSDARGLPKQTAEANLTVSVRDSELVVTSASPPRGMKGADYYYQLTAQGGSPPYAWHLSDGHLPPGLAVNSDGAVRGSPTVAGRFDFAVQVADSVFRTTSQNYAIAVIDPPRITEVVYKAKKLKLTLTGERFDEMATLFIDAHEVRPKNHDDTMFVVKQLLLEPGTHDIRIVNPDGGTATVALTVP